MISLAIQVVNNRLAFVLNLLTFTYDFGFRSALLKTLILFSPVCSSLQQMYFYFERFHFCLCSERLVVVERWIDPWFPAQIYLRHKNMKISEQSSYPVTSDLCLHYCKQARDFRSLIRSRCFGIWCSPVGSVYVVERVYNTFTIENYIELSIRSHFRNDTSFLEFGICGWSLQLIYFSSDLWVLLIKWLLENYIYVQIEINFMFVLFACVRNTS